MIDNILCDTATQKMTESSSPVGGHDDHIRADLMGKMNDPPLLVNIVVDVCRKILQHKPLGKAFQV